MRRGAIRAAVWVAGTIGVAWLASCASILGLDDDLTGDDGGADGGGPGPGGDGGVNDATTGSDAAGDSGSGSEGGPIDAGDAAAAVWMVDTSFHDGGALAVTVMTYTEGTGSLEVLNAPDGGDVFVVGLGSQLASMKSVLIAIQGADKAFPVPVNDVNPTFLVGAFPVNGTLMAIVEDADGGFFVIDALGSPSGGQDLIGSNAHAPRMVAHDAGSYVGPGMSDAGSAKVTVTTTKVTNGSLVDSTPGNVLLALGTAGDGSTSYGGYVGTVSSQAPLLYSDGQLISSVATSGKINSAITDFASTSAGLFAVGYSGSSFAVWPVQTDAGTVAIVDTTGAPFTSSTSFPYSFVRTAVSMNQTIFALGAFGDPYLATFDEHGQPAPLLVQPDGDTGTSLDLATTLQTAVGTGSVTAWYPGGLLANGDTVYAAFAASGTSNQWVLLRLRRTTR